jgi:hypothetical protein
LVDFALADEVEQQIEPLAGCERPMEFAIRPFGFGV